MDVVLPKVLAALIMKKFDLDNEEVGVVVVSNRLEYEFLCFFV
jgi:hypothetical protein